MSVSPPATSEVTEAVLETAAMWRQRMVSPGWSADDDAELEAWVQADKRHERAFNRTGDVWDSFGHHAASPEMIAVRKELLGRVQREGQGRWGRADLVRRLPRRRLIAAAVAAAAVVGVVWPLATQGEVYQTGLAERRAVILRDGSLLSLDAMSRVSVRYSRDARRLVLTRGQARFDVAHDPTRPFSVAARDRTVVATGTAFNIDMVAPEVRVTLIEGKVLVLPRRAAPIPLIETPSPKARPIELRAGQALVATEGAQPEVVAKVDVDRATAWQRGKLMFDKVPLVDAVERINRYSDRKISVGDPQAAAMSISGVFNMGDVDAFLDSAASFLPLAVEDAPNGFVLRSTNPHG